MVIYRNIKTEKEVDEFEALDYVCKKCGIKFEEIEDNLEQLELKEMLLQWYFSGNWIEIDEDDEEYPNAERNAILADMLYDENLDRKMGI